VTERLLRLLGLGVRARSVVVGVAGVQAQLARNKLVCVVLAADVTRRTLDKVDRPARARGIKVLKGPPAEQLGAALGRPPVQAVGVSDRALARGLVEASRSEDRS
jgi:ribosomal protein L7Ae-like RNA K-turn-binding protein